MTRINLVNPSLLTDQHLFAEFREIKMVPASLNRSLMGVTGNRDKIMMRIPIAYPLGAGHVTFFYDKATYLKVRFKLLCEELARRDVKFNERSELDPTGVFDRFGYDNYFWSPTRPDFELIEERIRSRIDMKPDWYRYYGEKITTNPDILRRVRFDKSYSYRHP